MDLFRILPATQQELFIILMFTPLARKAVISPASNQCIKTPCYTKNHTRRFPHKKYRSIDHVQCSNKEKKKEKKKRKKCYARYEPHLSLFGGEMAIQVRKRVDLIYPQIVMHTFLDLETFRVSEKERRLPE